MYTSSRYLQFFKVFIFTSIFMFLFLTFFVLLFHRHRWTFYADTFWTPNDNVLAICVLFSSGIFYAEAFCTYAMRMCAVHYSCFQYGHNFVLEDFSSSIFSIRGFVLYAEAFCAHSQMNICSSHFATWNISIEAFYKLFEETLLILLLLDEY